MLTTTTDPPRCLSVCLSVCDTALYSQLIVDGWYLMMMFTAALATG